MSNRTAITVLVSPDVLAYLQAHAQQAAERLQRDGNHEPGEDIPIESVASVILEDAVRALLLATASTADAPNTDQEEVDEETAARVLELLSAGQIDKAHELAKTIETTTIREAIERQL